MSFEQYFDLQKFMLACEVLNVLTGLKTRQFIRIHYANIPLRVPEVVRKYVPSQN